MIRWGGITKSIYNNQSNTPTPTPIFEQRMTYQRGDLGASFELRNNPPIALNDLHKVKNGQKNVLSIAFF